MGLPCASFSIPSCTVCPFWYACSMSPALYSFASGSTMPPVIRCSTLSLFCKCMYRLHSCAWVSGTASPLLSTRPMSTSFAPGPANSAISFRCSLPVTLLNFFSPSMVISVCRRCPSFSIRANFSICPSLAYPPIMRNTRSAPSISRLYFVSRLCSPSSAPPGWLPLLARTSPAAVTAILSTSSAFARLSVLFAVRITCSVLLVMAFSIRICSSVRGR